MFKRNKSVDAVKDFEGSGGKFLNKSGIYNDVTIKALIYDEAENGGAVINFYINHQGEDQVVYGDLRVANKGGVENTIGHETLNELLVILDVDLDEPVETELPIGKKKAPKDVMVFEDVVDEVITIRIMNKYSVWNNNIMEKTVISKFYRNDDKATAAEIVLDAEKPGEVELGAKFAKDQEFADNIKYEDGLTAEQVNAWIKAKRPRGTAGAGATASSKPSFKKPTKKFGK
jgi:hypothetical protein